MNNRVVEAQIFLKIYIMCIIVGGEEDLRSGNRGTLLNYKGFQVSYPGHNFFNFDLNITIIPQA